MIDFADATEAARCGQDLSVQDSGHLIDLMLRGEAPAEAVGEFLLALREKGEAVSELVGAATAMRSHMTRIQHRHKTLLDTCGTGGSGSGTFNISTAVAILTAACGVPVAKHGNRKATSLTGSADVLECLGVAIDSEPEQVANRLDEVGICFCFAAKMHPAMKHVISIRRALGVPTLFNMLGPLCNPAGATHQLLGTASATVQRKMADAIAQLDTHRSFVLHAEDGQDEVSLSGPTLCLDVTPAASAPLEWTPASFGFFPAGLDSIAAANPLESAEIIRHVFDGHPGPARDVVVAGTAAALLLVERVADLTAGVKLATERLDEGAAREKLHDLKA